MKKLVDVIELLDLLSISLIQFRYKLLIDDLDDVHIKIFIKEQEVEKMQVKRRYEDLKKVEDYLCKKYLGYE